MSIIDTTDLEVEDTATVELDDKHGNDLLHKDGARRSITHYGPGTKQFATAKAKAKIRNMKTFRNKTPDPDGDAAATASFLADITISFNNFGLSEADQVRKNFYEFYLNPKVGYITSKVDESAGDWANF